MDGWEASRGCEFVKERERGFGHSKLSAGKVKGLNEAADRPLTCWENELLGG